VSLRRNRPFDPLVFLVPELPDPLAALLPLLPEVPLAALLPEVPLLPDALLLPLAVALYFVFSAWYPEPLV